MSSIDDPIDAAKKQVSQETGGVPELIGKIATEMLPWLGLAKIIMDHYSPEPTTERVKYMLDVVAKEVQAQGKKFEELGERLESPSPSWKWPATCQKKCWRTTHACV
jgi:hypothetical protein